MKLLDQSPLSSALSGPPRELSCHGTSLPVLLFRTDPRNGYHNTHHDLFPLAFALPSYPLPADLSFSCRCDSFSVSLGSSREPLSCLPALSGLPRRLPSFPSSAPGSSEPPLAGGAAQYTTPFSLRQAQILFFLKKMSSPSEKSVPTRTVRRHKDKPAAPLGAAGSEKYSPLDVDH